ncbi:MAG TPA: DUF2062 domain-containing protein [Allosphingosinicella sp.]|uniref:DUF2062 domain-containing protein n=1 Tax=Allosphingosinicella sp. TaxID=2823234 RepID=UPI002EDAA6B1
MVERIGRWLEKNAPKREELAQNRFMRPFAGRVLRSDLWRFTRRSVPRGVGVGLLVGIFLMIPGLQIIGAALLSVPFRANIPIAAAMTFLSNPATTPFILVASIAVGNYMGFRADIETFYTLYGRGAGVGEWLAWLGSDAAPALITGLLVIAAASAAIGYVIAMFGWRWWTGRKWRRRGKSIPS